MPREHVQVARVLVAGRDRATRIQQQVRDGPADDLAVSHDHRLEPLQLESCLAQQLHRRLCRGVHRRVHTLHVFGSVYRLLALFRVEVHRERQLDDDARYLEGGDTRYAETETQRERAYSNTIIYGDSNSWLDGL